jgi:hypothetical protein
MRQFRRGGGLSEWHFCEAACRTPGLRFLADDEPQEMGRWVLP